MANDVKRNDRRSFRTNDDRAAPPTGPARLTLLACVVALAALLTQLPGPAEALDVLTGTGAVPTSPNAPLAAVQSMLLITAGLLAWSLAGWAVVVLGVGLIARLPGRSGRRARRLLPRIAPASVGRLVLAAVGVSLIAGTAACAAPGAPGPAAAGASVSVWSTPASSATSTTPPTAPTTGPGASVTIDWPDPSTAPTPASASAAASAPASASASASAPAPAPAPAPATLAPATTLTPAAAAATTPLSDPHSAAADPGATATIDTPEPPTGSLVNPASAAGPGTSATGGQASTNTPPAERSAAPAPSSVVRVQPGDSLWRIATAALGPDATDQDVDNAWRAWYFVNREVIGDDPDTILPGQDLLVPSDAGQVRP